MIDHSSEIDSLLRIGQLVKMGLKNAFGSVSAMSGAAIKEGDQVHTYSTRIDNILMDQVVVAWPTDKGMQVPIRSGQVAQLITTCDRGVYQLNSHILQAINHPLPMLHIARRGDWVKIQRRTCVRLNVSVAPRELQVIRSRGRFPSDLRPYFGAIHRAVVLAESRRAEEKKGGSGAVATAIAPCVTETWDEEQADMLEVESAAGMIRNLSAAGILLSSVEHVELGAIIRVVFPLVAGQQDIDVLARIVWTDEEDGERKMQYRSGCEFLNLGMRYQDCITRFIFAKQAELRRTGWL